MNIRTIYLKRIKQTYRIILLCFVPLISSGVYSQTEARIAIKKLNLLDAIKFGKANSIIARQLKSTYQSKLYHFNSVKLSLLPQINLGGNIPGLNRSIVPVIQPDGTTALVQQSQSNSSAVLSVQQPLLATGGSIYVSSDIYRYDILGYPVNQFYWQTDPLKIGLNQPLSSFNYMKWNLKEEKLTIQQASKQQLEGFEDLSIQITQAYFDLFIARMEHKNALYNQSINDTIYNLSKARYNLGKIAENDLLQSELALMNAQSNVSETGLQVLIAEKKLKNILTITDTTSIEVDPIGIIPDFAVDLKKAQIEARDNRSDYIAMELARTNAEMTLKQMNANRYINGNLNVGYGFNQTAATFNSAYQGIQNSQQATISFNMPIFNWGKTNSDYKSALANLESVNAGIETQEQNLELDLLSKVQTLQQLKFNLVISSKADTIAQKRYEVTKNRYLIGKLDITNLTIAQNEKDQALINFARNLQNFWLAYYQLRRVTLYDFQLNKKITGLD